jgi:CheY-specific phosphatase CheX
MPPGARPVPADLNEQLLAPFVTAVETALREVALTDSAVSRAYRVRSHGHCSALVVMIDLDSAAEGCLALGVAPVTAAALARRVLSETLANPDEALVRDCIGEIANVAAGEAKALLHGTPYRFRFGTPRFAAGGDAVVGGLEDRLIAVMATDVGEVIVELFVRRAAIGE